MIRLVDLLSSQGIKLGSYKVHLATAPSGEMPLDAYLNGRFKEWQERQSQRNFSCDHVIGLIHLGESRWLLAGAYEILGEPKRRQDWWQDRTRCLPGQKDLVGRVIVGFKRTDRASYRWGHAIEDRLEVAQVRETPYAVQEFPGYNRFVIDHDRLRLLVERQEPSWKAALSSVRGVYLIVDSSTGKHYVGSAPGKGGFWQRWHSYAAIGHGGNKELKALLAKKGALHSRHFQYSVLEIADLETSEAQVLERETHWKDMLLSRTFGLNLN